MEVAEDVVRSQGACRKPTVNGDTSPASLHSSDPGVALRPAVVAEVIVRDPLDSVRLTEYGSPWGQQEQPVA
jgi:hypothetical protein